MKKILSMVISASMLLSVMSISAGAANTEPEVDLSTASFEMITDEPGYDYIEVATLSNGDTIVYKHFTNQDTGRNAVEVTDIDGTVTLIEIDPVTYDMYINGEKSDSVITYRLPTNSVSPNGVPQGWHVTQDSPIIQSYELANFTVATLAGAIAKFTSGPVNVISNAVRIIFKNSNWCSAKKWMYLNYTDYGYKVGSYNEAEIYDGKNATGNLVEEFTTPIVVR